MANTNMAAIVSDISDPDLEKFVHEGLPYDCEDNGELRSALKALSEVDMTSAYSFNKLEKLENLLQYVIAGERDIEASALENENISAEFIEKAFIFDLLYAILNFELRELDNLLVDLHDLILAALHKISTSENSTELLTRLGDKLHDSENILKPSQDRVLEMKIQLAKLQMTSFIFKQNEYRHNLDMGVLARTERNHELPKVEQRHVHRMLEVSLARELELEKKLTLLKQNEEDLKLKIRLMEQVAGSMEEAAEVAWGRFLEADNTLEVMTGISKEIMGNLQTVNFNLRSSTKSEGELKYRLQDCINQLNEKEISIQELNSSIAQLMADNAEVTGLRERVQMLEEKLIKTENRLMEADASSKTSQDQLEVMEVEVGSLRETVHAAESRARSVEEKNSQLTDSNLELTEEIDFLKGTNDSNAKKASVLEKQLRELDIQLQHARASSEAGQEQQGMLYTAIWDMETLIDELKQKVANAEMKAESAEEQCVLLSETNSELNNELDFLRSRMESMGTSLNEATLQKQSSAKDIGVRTGLIMNTVMQLTMERERIQKQVASLAKENKLLREKLQKKQVNASITVLDNRSLVDKGFMPSEPDLADMETARTSAVKVAQVSSESLQVEQSPMDASLDENGTSSSSSQNHGSNLIMKLEDESSRQTGKSQRT